MNQWIYYDRQGNVWNQKNTIPHIVLVVGEDIVEPGYYFFDECEQLHGPHDSFEEAVGGLDCYIEEYF